MTLLTQAQVELGMYRGGIARAEGMMNKAEEAQQAHRNPYAKEVFREFVLPLAEAIRTELAHKGPGARKAHAALLGTLDPDAVAFLAVRTALSICMGTNQEVNHRSVAFGIGLAVHNELVLDQIADSHPELYHTLAKDLGRRLSKNERHRMKVFKMQADKAGVDIIEWPLGAREQVGMYLMGLLQVLGLIEIGTEVRCGMKRVAREVWLTTEVLEKINQIRSHVALTMPTYGPCVEPPRDWVSAFDGGFHTVQLRRTHNCVVKAHASARDLYRAAEMPTFLSAVNALQRTAWQVNGRVLDVVLELAKFTSTKEIVSLSDAPKPPAPAWLADEKRPKDEWPEANMLEFLAWKREVTEWHTQRKLLGTRYGRFYSSTRSATTFRDYPAIYFVYFADSRGRLYPMTYGMSPQGSDLQKALLRFAEGKPVDTPEAIRWFHVQGANKWGFDKATLEERHQWVVDRQDLLLSFAADPINNRGWLDADSPLQFLAWCLEYADYCNDQTGEFLSHLPISMDGSCNGLQNLSALLRDPVGGQATNLTANAKMEDIYRRVAEAARARMLAGEQNTITAKWLAHGIDRSVVKRGVMTTPYGVTRMAAMEYVITDYLAEGKGPFDKTEYRAAAAELMKAVWPAIGDVIVKGREAMAWLKRSARSIVKALGDDDEPIIWWTSPSGFIASQSYFVSKVHRIRTRLAGEVAIRVLSETEDSDINRHCSGLAPNFVHSLDAAHLHLTTDRAARCGISSLAMIHDDYGTHAADAQRLYTFIREEFVSMYEGNDPVADLRAQYPMISDPPSKGDLDIRQVLQSPFFFS